MMEPLHYSAEEFNEDVVTLATGIRIAMQDGRKYDSIYGVPRGGMLLAGALAIQLDLPIVGRDNIGAWTLVVDDVADSGKTRARFRKNDFAVLHVKDTCDMNAYPDYRVHGGVSDWIVYFWEEQRDGNDTSIEDNIVRILQYIGENPSREGLLDTPKRIVKSWREIYGGYKMDPATLFTTFEKGTYDQIVLLKDIEFFSMCEHHNLPFFGKAHVAYLPDKKVIGISNLARILDVFARRMQIQELLGEQVVQTLMEHLQPKGAACIIEASHLCMRARGVQKQHSTMVTSSLKGVFLEDPAAREELMMMIDR